MRRRLFAKSGKLLVALIATGAVGWWAAGWMHKGPVDTRGGLYFPTKKVLPAPHFRQADPTWGNDLLGATDSTLAAEGCAVASAAMSLAARGMDIDPARLNAFLTELPGGYTPRGWIYWEKAAEFDPEMAASLLPHYEDDPSYFLIDWNLLHGNPVIARVRYPSGMTHFVLIIGKTGFDYLIHDPARPADESPSMLKEFAGPVEALRFYKR
jgi:hypothetical protein